MTLMRYFDGLVQDCSNSIANALELLQSCSKPSIYITKYDSNDTTVQYFFDASIFALIVVAWDGRHIGWMPQSNIKHAVLTKPFTWGVYKYVDQTSLLLDDTNMALLKRYLTSQISAVSVTSNDK